MKRDILYKQIQNSIPNKGIYLVVGYLSKRVLLKTRGKEFHLPAGWYYYCGSAMSGLGHRIRRHLSSDKKLHWHIDYLLSVIRIKAVATYIVGSNRLEHELAEILSGTAGLSGIDGFGVGECSCRTHLFLSWEPIRIPIWKDVLRRHIEIVFENLDLDYGDKLTGVEHFKDPFHILVSCIISLRTRDEVTTLASRRLLSKAPTPEKMLTFSTEEIENLIYPAGFYKKKARNLRHIAKILVEEFDSRVPSDKETLLSFPNVGLKTANLVLANGFGHNEICVDTHVHRISNRLGFIRTKTPEESEKVLKQLLPRKIIRKANRLMVKHGQTICRPISPMCSKCPLKELCLYGMSEKSKK